MEQVKGKKTWVVPTIFFAGLAIIGLIIGGVLWAVISSPDFFTCFCISYALAFPSYFLWSTTGYLLSSENRKKVLGVLGIIGSIIKCRLEYARKLLDATTLSISEVAEQSGFKHSRNFSTVFKNAMGMSPSDYRKKDSRPS